MKTAVAHGWCCALPSSAAGTPPTHIHIHTCTHMHMHTLSKRKIRGMHTIIRDRETSMSDFTFYADRLNRLVVEAGETPRGAVALPSCLSRMSVLHQQPGRMSDLI